MTKRIHDAVADVVYRQRQITAEDDLAMIRQAIAAMRHYATHTTKAGTCWRWKWAEGDLNGGPGALLFTSQDDVLGSIRHQGDAEHMAAWHPRVALVAADLLEEHADGIESMRDHRDHPGEPPRPLPPPGVKMLALARAFLQED